MLVVAVAMIGSLTVLPAALSALGDKVDKGRIPFLGPQPGARRRRRRPVGPPARRRRPPPAVSLVVAGTLLLALCLPALGLRTITRASRRCRATSRSCAATTASRPRSPATASPPRSSCAPPT
jgi:uncharacterized membrane protein YdfJ with MMPL/SSD domain